MTYDVSSRGYLARARVRLDEATPASLFYAAFELRCGIETRLQEYLEAHTEALDLRKVGWRIAFMGKTLEREFSSGEKIARVRVYRDDGGSLIGTWYHTPVSPSLRSKAEQLGNYLHAVIPHRAADDPWWVDTRTLLETVYSGLWLATRGRLLSMPLLNRATGQLHVSMEPEEGTSVQELRQLMNVGSKHVLDIKYLDAVPESLASGA